MKVFWIYDVNGKLPPRRYHAFVDESLVSTCGELHVDEHETKTPGAAFCEACKAEVVRQGAELAEGSDT